MGEIIGLIKIVEINIKGASFCQEIITMQRLQLILFMIWGNQKWNGGSPSLIIRADVKIKWVKLNILYEVIDISMDAHKIIATEAIAWGRKYLIHDSVELLPILYTNKGIILIRLISNPIQAKNQELEEIEITVPIIKNLRNTSW